MIRHVVLTKFQLETSEETINEIYFGLSKLTESLSGANNFTGGRSKSPEQLERGYNHGFVIDFHNWSDLDAYSRHPLHKELGSRIIQNAIGGIDGIMVLDIEV